MKLITQIEDEINQIAKMIKNSNYLIVFTGAGVSTESGIADFRGKMVSGHEGIKVYLPSKGNISMM